jgi:CubicO group peptidase (beta-lactamase class C family)
MKRSLVSLPFLAVLLLAEPLLPVLFASAPGAGTACAGWRLNHEIDDIFSQWDTGDSPGTAVLITDRGRTVLARGYGQASLEHGVPITPSTRFDLASTSKQFTAAAILLLEERGEVALDDDIREYLPELPDLGRTVMIRHLLHHTSGLWDYWQVLQFVGFSRYDYLDLEGMLTLLSHQEEFAFTPGSKWTYSNSNYALLAEIVARVTEEPFEEWTAGHIFEPLGMHDTRFWKNCFEVFPDAARPYLPDDGGFKAGPPADIAFAGQGHVFSNLNDMAIWLDSIRTGKLAGQAFVDKMFKKGTLDSGDEIFYAAGLGVHEYRGVTTVGHSGQTGGYKSEMLYCPEAEVGVVVLANLRSVSASDLARSVLDVYLSDRLEPLVGAQAEESEEAPFIDIDSDILERYEGSYQIEGAPVVISAMRVGDNLLGAMSGEGMAYFYPVSETVFMTGHRRASIEFLPGSSGEFDRIRLDLEDEEMWANRIEGGVTEDERREYAGRYYSDALGMVYSVHVEDGDLMLSHRRIGEEKTMMLYSGVDSFASGFGFLDFERDQRGAVTGFRLWHEFFGEGRVSFERVQS